MRFAVRLSLYTVRFAVQVNWIMFKFYMWGILEVGVGTCVGGSVRRPCHVGVRDTDRQRRIRWGVGCVGADFLL